MVEKHIPLVKATKNAQKDVVLDPHGFFVIEVRETSIFVEYYSNVYKHKKIVSGKLEMVFTGKKADAVSDTIAREIRTLLPEHYMYLGRELQKAQQALEQHKKYVQGGC